MEYDILGPASESHEEPLDEYKRLLEEARNLETDIYIATERLASDVRRLNAIHKALEKLRYEL